MFFANLWSLLLTVPATIMVGVVLRQAWLNYRATSESYGERKLIEQRSRLLKARVYAGFCGMLVLALALAALGLARPQRLSDTASFPQGTMDVICISDVSRSMAAQDYRGQMNGEALKAGTRLDMVRQIIRDRLIPALSSNRMGIVSFAGQSFDQAYLGDDYKALTWVVENQMLIGSALGEGANLEAGLQMAIHYMDVDARLAKQRDPQAQPKKERQRVIVIFSDGGFDEESPKFQEIVVELAKRKVKVLLVGMGGRTPLAISVEQLGARDRYMMSGQGKPFLVIDGQTQLSARDEESLHKMADKLKARYIRLDSMDDFQLDAEDFELESQIRRSEEELFRWPVCLAFVAIFAGQLLLLAPVFSFKRSPKTQADDESAESGKGS